MAFAGSIPITFIAGGPSNPGGTQYYPYTINANGQDVTVACDSYFEHVTKDENYTGWASTYNDLSNTVFNHGVAAPDLQYQELAYLYTEVQTFSSPSPEAAAVNYAIWDLFEAAPGIDGGSQITQAQAATDFASDSSDTDNSAYWLNLASLQNYTNFNFSNFVIYSPDLANTTGWTDGQPQEFIGEVPEPATLALFGSGLLGLGLFFKRRLAVGDADLNLNA
jgi:hypothetical protein